jgi:hypothetical protein
VFWGERHHGRRSELGIEMLAGTSLGSALAHLRDWAFSLALALSSAVIFQFPFYTDSGNHFKDLSDFPL